MDSSGRGEDSPEAYRGVVIPAGHQPAQVQQPQSYGEHVQPAGGSPWGAPEQAQEPADATQMLPPYPGAHPQGLPTPAARPAAPAAPIADATQMLPPYPGAHPQGLPAAPIADATQMLPPYPGGNPGGHLPPQPGPQSAGLPPRPPIPPQAPPGGHAPEPPAAEATQALHFFKDQHGQDPHGGPGYDQQQPYGQQGGYEQQGYGGQGGGPQSFGDQDSYGGQGYPGADGYEQQQPSPAHDSDYDHLFRNDVPSPAPIRPRIIQPPDRQQPAQPYGQQQGGYPPGYDQGYDQQYAYDDGDGGAGRRKMSPKVLIGIVVAGCVVAGLVVGGLLNGGGGGDKTANTADKSSAQPSAGASGSGASAGSDAVKQQASALDALLSTSDTSRSSVVNAVESIKGCNKLPTAASDLNTAAAQRKALVTKLGTLTVDKLPDHAALTDALTKAWQASSAADAHYANWAGQAQSNPKVCHGGHARITQETQAANRQSGTATIQKKRAVKLWNTIAKQYGLTERQYSQL